MVARFCETPEFLDFLKLHGTGTGTGTEFEYDLLKLIETGAKFLIDTDDKLTESVYDDGFEAGQQDGYSPELERLENQLQEAEDELQNAEDEIEELKAKLKEYESSDDGDGGVSTV